MYEISSENESREVKLASLRNKIKNHSESKAHHLAEKILQTRKKKNLEKTVEDMDIQVSKCNVHVFRTAYYVAKNNRPFSDIESVIELQKINGVNMGVILHSRNTAVNIINLISDIMRRRIVDHIINGGKKIAILIDESTTISKKTVLVVYLHVCIRDEPEFVFFDLVQLERQTSASICDALLNCLKLHGFREEYLQKHWISFVSDGASVMLGKRAGAGHRLKEMYPKLFLWHCLSHRLELGISDIIDQIKAVNHFKFLLDKIYSHFSQSPKNQQELKHVAEELEAQFLKIGRILDIRWVASSCRTVRAVWKSYPALHAYFIGGASDSSQYATTRELMRGLAKKLSSSAFILNLAFMYDILEEMSSLSLQLQSRNTDMQQADIVCRRAIHVVDTGKYYTESKKALLVGVFKRVPVTESGRIKEINPEHFMTELSAALKSRLCGSGVSDDIDSKTQLLSDMKILTSSLWPENPSLCFGENEIRRICEIFDVEAQPAVLGMRDFIENPHSLPESLKNFQICLRTFQ